MKILTGPSDEETLIALKDLSADEIFLRVRNFNLEEKWFQLAVDKGLLDNLSPRQIFLKSAEGGSLQYLESSHIDLIKKQYKNLKGLIDEAICLAAKFGHLSVVEYLFNFGGNINLVLINSSKSPHIEDYALQYGAKFHYKVKNTNGESHSVLYYRLKEIQCSIAEYIDREM